MTITGAQHGEIAGSGGATHRRPLLEPVRVLKFGGNPRQLPRPLTVIQDNGVWMIDDPQAVTSASEATYADTLREYVQSLNRLRGELADSEHPANRRQHAAVVAMLDALER